MATSPTSDDVKKESIRILICSANLGNAKPDAKSMEAWVPLDGLCKFVLPPKGKTPEFPICMDPRRAKNPPLRAGERESETETAAATAAAAGVPKQVSAMPGGGFDNIAFESMGGASYSEWDELNDNNSKSESSPMVGKDNGSSFGCLENAFPGVPFGELDASQLSTSSMPSLEAVDESQFDIIVIGMQEATFDMEEEAEKNERGEGEEGGEGEADEKPDFCTSDDDDYSLSSSSSDEEDEAAEGLVDEDTTAASTLSRSSTSSGDGEASSLQQKKKTRKKRSKVMAFSGAISKISKAATKQVVKVADKVGKATVKNAKTAKTLVTERDNTEKPVPTPQQISNLEADMTTWSDTTVLHYMFEGQLPSYTRVLSYQLGEMRLVIYYKSTDVNLDLLSVKTVCTGKHGLANKGGIVAEIAVNETTRLGFLTAHLEAHVSSNGFLEKSCGIICGGCTRSRIGVSSRRIIYYDSSGLNRREPNIVRIDALHFMTFCVELGRRKHLINSMRRRNPISHLLWVI
jgi:hypothetical protein